MVAGGSLGHALDHLRLNSAVAVVLSIKVLRLVAHPVSCVANNWDLNFGVVWKLLSFTLFRRVHGDLHAGGEGRELLVLANVSVLQAGSHWVHVEERVLSVLDARHWFLVQTLVALVPNCRQVKQRTSLLHFNSLEPKIQINSVNRVSEIDCRGYSIAAFTYSASWNSPASL